MNNPTQISIMYSALVSVYIWILKLDHPSNWKTKNLSNFIDTEVQRSISIFHAVPIRKRLTMAAPGKLQQKAILWAGHNSSSLPLQRIHPSSTAQRCAAPCNDGDDCWNAQGFTTRLAILTILIYFVINGCFENFQ